MLVKTDTPPMRADQSGIVCTCPEGWGPHQFNYDHDFNCDLWNHDGFADGKCAWDDEDERLVWFTNGPPEYDEVPFAGDPIQINDAMATLLEDIDKILDEQGMVEVRNENDIDPELDFTCTCALPSDPEPKTHDTDCDLWHSMAWMNWYAEWDHVSFELYWVELDDDGNPIAPDWGTLDSDDKKTAATTTDQDDDAWEASYRNYMMGVCRHKEKRVTFPDGTRVFASSKFTRDKTEPGPDFAVYLDSSWWPSSIATYIPWTDFGLPTGNLIQVAGTIVEAFETAASGLTVEIGCIGGHGRTGTVLACMAILAGVPGPKAVAWVRTNYCEKAVEGDEQKWLVHWFDCWHRGVPTTQPKPAPWVSSFAGTGGKYVKCDDGIWRKEHEKGTTSTDVDKLVADSTPSTSSAPTTYLSDMDKLDDPKPCPWCGVMCSHKGYMCDTSGCTGFNTTRVSPKAVAAVNRRNRGLDPDTGEVIQGTMPKPVPHPAQATVSINKPQSSSRKNGKRRGKRK